MQSPKMAQKRGDNWAWLAVLNVACLALGSYWALGLHVSRTERMLYEITDESEIDVHKTFMEDPARNFPGLALSVVIGSIATAAGVGGGAFFVPLFNILLKFSIKGGMALSQAVIAGGALAGVALTLHKKHPYDPSKPLIDFDLALLLLPVVLLGVSVGVLANVLFPNWLITVLLLLLLLFLTLKTFKKALSLHRCEVEYLAHKNAEDSGEQPQSPAAGAAAAAGGNAGGSKNAATAKTRAGACPGNNKVVDARGKDAPRDLSPAASSSGCSGNSASPECSDIVGHAACTVEMVPGSNRAAASERKPCSAGAGEENCGQGAAPRTSQLNSQLSTESMASEGARDGDHHQDHHRTNAGQPATWFQVVVLLVCWGVFVAFQLLQSHWGHCSTPYWAIYSVQAALCLVAECIFVALVYKRKQSSARNLLEQPMLASVYEEPPAWTLPRLIRSAVITLLSGFIAGLLGIGGGMIVNPLLLEFGTHPHVAAATSTLMVLFSSSSAALSFGFGGLLNLQFSLIFGLCCMGASLVGVLIVSRIVDRSGKASIIVFLLALVIATGATLTAAFGGRFAVQDLTHHRNIGFSSLCASSART